MSKLAKFRQWLEIEEAAQYLSAVWGESVTPADVLRLGLDGKLTLSVHLVNLGSGRLVNIVPLESLTWNDVPHPFELNVTMRIPDGDKINDTEAIKLPDTSSAEKLEGVYDLPMIGAEVLEIEHAYQYLVGGPPVELEILAGCFARRDGRTYQLLERWPSNDRTEKRNEGKHYMHLDWFLPAQTLPAGSVVVVRTDALRELEPEPTTPATLDPRKEKTYLRIIKALTAEANLDLAQHYKTAEVLAQIAAKNGYSFPQKNDTVAAILKAARQVD